MFSMKQENSKSPKNKAIQGKDDRWIDVHNDDVMREMGFLRPFIQSPRDKSVWTKNPHEKHILGLVRNQVKLEMRPYSIPVKHVPVYTKLIIYLKKNKKFSKTTYSIECWQHEIGNILNKYVGKNRDGYAESLISKYVFNGKTYRPNERPKFLW